MNQSAFQESGVKLTGALRIEVIGEDGTIKDVREIPNLVVTAGKGVIADRMKGTPAKAAMTHMAVGTSSTTPAAGDTTLGAEVAGSRTALTSTTVSGSVITYVCSFPAGTGTGALVEAGIFNAASSGDMLCRTTYSVVNKGASDSMTITWTVTIN